LFNHLVNFNSAFTGRSTQIDHNCTIDTIAKLPEDYPLLHQIGESLCVHCINRQYAMESHLAGDCLGVTVVDAATLLSELSAAQRLDSIRSVVKRRLTKQLLPTPTGVYLALLVALRVTELTCESIDQLFAQETSGAYQDAGVCRPCRRKMKKDFTGPNEHSLSDLAPIIDMSTNYLQKLDAFRDYATLITALIQMSSFCNETGDLVIHRCLLASAALFEVYMREILGKLNAANFSYAPRPARYAKGNVKEAVVGTVSGPILGHHQILILNCVVCSDEEMEPRLAFMSYKDNLCWMNDWAMPNREDGDIFAAVTALTTIDSQANHVKSCAPVHEYPWRARNETGNKLTQWLTKLDYVCKDISNSSLTHTGALCAMNDWLRMVIVASTAYGTYGFWPSPRWIPSSAYAENVCATIGAMIRGWAIDHDSEASIGEHNMLNWMCRDCSTSVTREVLGPANAMAVRDDFTMRIAWGPQTYFYFSPRHVGIARRVDNLLEKGVHSSCHIPVRPVTPSCSPIAAGDSVPVMVTKILALIGVELVDFRFGDLGEEEWDCCPRICLMCQFDGFRAQLFMVSSGATRLATRIPDRYRAQLTDLVNTYGFRLFPAVQVRSLVLCTCLSKWKADVMSYGYAEGGTRCGQSDCSITTHHPSFDGLSTITRKAECEETTVKEILLCQARLEATSYAQHTGQKPWLDVVSEPLRALT
jgi:hypothetical protein